VRPQNKKHKTFHAQTTKNTKNKTTKKEKQTTTKQSLFIVAFLSHSRPLYSSHTTHHPTNNTQPDTTHVKRPQPAKRSCFIKKGVIHRTTNLCCPRHPTACHKTKQTKTQTHLPKTLQPIRLKDRKKPLFHQLPKPHTQHMKCVRHLSSPENKNLPPA